MGECSHWWESPTFRTHLVDETHMIWMSKIRLRVLAFLLGLVFTAIGIVSLTTIPAWPIVGVAVAAAAVAVNTMTSKLKVPICHGCGKPLGDAPSGQYGVICPSCGFLTQTPHPDWLDEPPMLSESDDSSANHQA